MVRPRQCDNTVTAAERAAVAAMENRYRLGYRKPLRAFLPYAILFGLLTYLAVTTELSHSGKDRLLPRFLRKKHTRCPWLYYIPQLLEKLAMNKLYKTSSSICGGLRGLQFLCLGTWLSHLGQLAYAVYNMIRFRSTPMTMLRYAAGLLAGGVTQFLPFLAALKAFRYHQE